MKNGSTTLAVNDTVPVAQLGNVTYQGALNNNTNVTFTRQGHDGTVYSSNTSTVSITINPVNDIPTVSNFAKSVNEDVLLTFTAADFTSNFSDIDGDNLTQIRITGLPSHGTLKNGSTTLAVNDTVPVAQLGNVTYQGALHNNANVTFTRQGYDGTAYSTNSTVTVTINSVNDEPVGTNNTVTTDEDVQYTFAAANFGFIDPNDTPANTLSGVRITTLP